MPASLFVPPGSSPGAADLAQAFLDFYAADLTSAREAAASTGVDQYVPVEELSPGDAVRVNRIGEVNLPGGLVLYPGCGPGQLSREFRNCNEGQRSAVLRSLSASDYVLINGFPGDHR